MHTHKEHKEITPALAGELCLERDFIEVNFLRLIQEEWILFIRSITVIVVDNANVVAVLVYVRVASVTKLLKEDHDVIMRRTYIIRERLSAQ